MSGDEMSLVRNETRGEKVLFLPIGNPGRALRKNPWIAGLVAMRICYAEVMDEEHL
jgi:hypothetical protein